jgi:hypothetical protein
MRFCVTSAAPFSVAASDRSCFGIARLYSRIKKKEVALSRPRSLARGFSMFSDIV